MKFIITIITSIFLALTATAGAVDKYNIERKVICHEQPFRLAYYQFGGFQEDGAGLDIDIIKELTKRTGCKFSTVTLPRAEIWRQIETGELDMTVSGIPTPEREKFAMFSIYIKQKNTLLMRREVPTQISNISEFTSSVPLKFGMVKSFKHGVYYDGFVDRMIAAGRVTTKVDSPSLFKGLVDNEYDGILAFPINYNKSLRQLGMVGKVRLGNWETEDKATPLGLVFSRKNFSTDEVKAWDAEIYQLQKSGKLMRMYLPYLKLYDAEKAVNF